MSTRREFLKQIGAAAMIGMAASPLSQCFAEAEKKITTVRRLKRPVAIAMWDFSWLLRRHPNGGFEDWERALDGLAERGYDAVRIDVFPHLVALAGREGSPKQFTFKGRPAGTHALWGNDVEVTVEPRAALLEFIPMCQKRNISVDVSTWFQGPAGTADKVVDFDGFVGVWEETLDFMERNGLMKNVLFVDLLNEYPIWNGFRWLKSAAQAAAKQRVADLPKAGEEHLQAGGKRKELPEAERAFYKQFSTRVLQHFRKRRPQYDFAASITASTDDFHPDRCADLSAMDALDMHVWFGHLPTIRQYDMGGAQNLKPEERGERYGHLKETWAAKRAELIGWMDETMGQYAQWGRQYGAVVGNTEGWGCIGWDDLAPLDWGFIKEAAEICVDLSLRHGYKFICTSNFTHPHFKRLWADIAWHKAITAKIRK